MARPRRDADLDPAEPDATGGEDELDTAAAFPIDIGEDLARAARRAAGEHRRLVVREQGEEIAAIIPIEDLRLLLRLEEEELDRIDREQARLALADPDNQPTVSWEAVKAGAVP